MELAGWEMMLTPVGHVSCHIWGTRSLSCHFDATATIPFVNVSRKDRADRFLLKVGLGW